MVATLLVLAMVVLFMAKPGHAMTMCEYVNPILPICAPYLTGRVTDPGAACCDNVVRLNNNVRTKTDRQTACQCLKDAASTISTWKDLAASQLPTRCNIQNIIPISRNANCQAYVLLLTNIVFFFLIKPDSLLISLI